MSTGICSNQSPGFHSVQLQVQQAFENLTSSLTYPCTRVPRFFPFGIFINNLIALLTETWANIHMFGQWAGRYEASSEHMHV